MADTPASKPNSACIGCRRRKLKCSRESRGCSNCLKSELPCVYPASETGVKRKRGPYKKDKPPRERHLEDLVKYLKPGAAQSDHHGDEESNNANASSSAWYSYDATSGTHLDGGESAFRRLRLDGRTDKSASNSEDLVKDALIALTQSSAVEREVVPDNGATIAQAATKAANEIGALGQHPTPRRVFEYWHLFVSRVDPLTKCVHCPTLAKTLFASIDNLRNNGPATQALLFAVYYVAVSTCTPTEARRRFNESRDVLLQRYGRTVEASLADNYNMPEMESVQAIVLYVIAIRREDNIANVRALFSLGVRMAQLMGLNKDPGQTYPPLQAEIRRRLWWHICSLESRGAEEGASRTSSIMQNTTVRMPANLFDFDLHESATERPQPRTGSTDMTFVLARFHCMRLLYRLVELRLRHAADVTNSTGKDLKSEQRQVLEQTKHELETQFVRYLDESRPYDLMCIRFLQVMLIKARLSIDHPFGQVPSRQMSNEQRFDLLQASVDIIAYTHVMSAEEKKGLQPWLWYVRGWTQWHSLAIVIAELGQCTNERFTYHAWAILNPLLSRWEKVYSMKREEPAWDHVNTLIERARQMRQQLLPSSQPLHLQAAVMRDTAARPTHQDTSTSVSQDVQSHQQGIYPMAESANTSAHHYLPPNLGSQLPPTNVGEVPFQTGCAPLMPGFDGNVGDFGTMEDLESIDFSAFNAVFGDMSWDTSSPNTDWSLEGINM